MLLGIALAHGDDPEAVPLPLPDFERIVIDDDFPGGYQVEVADVNGDGKPDIVALGGGTCAWYENPSWRKRIITGPETTPGIISSASIDLTGDGKAEVAIAYDFAMREPARGKLGLAVQGETPDDPWTFRTIADVPSIHRVRWGHFREPEGEGDRSTSPGLVAAPIFGEADEPPDVIRDEADVLLFSPGDDPEATPWSFRSLGRRPVLHAIEVLDGEGGATVYTADNLGVGISSNSDDHGGPRADGFQTVIPGAPGEVPFRGCSEVHLGTLGSVPFIATIEPWHGDTVAAWSLDPTRPFRRSTLDDTLDQGHALWLADVNGDGFDEVFAGHRGEDHRVSVYHFDGDRWQVTVLDREIAAQDLRGGDLTGDGIPDVVAIGGATGNVIWYRPRPDRP
jgi:hypothetical protein